VCHHDQQQQTTTRTTTEDIMHMSSSLPAASHLSRHKSDYCVQKKTDAKEHQKFISNSRRNRSTEILTSLWKFCTQWKFNFRQSTWDKSMIHGTLLGNTFENFRNTLGTCVQWKLNFSQSTWNESMILGTMLGNKMGT